MASSFSRTELSKRDDIKALVSDPMFTDAVRSIVRDVLVRELISSYLTERSIPTTSLRPVDLDGNEPADGTTLKYSQADDVVTF